VRVKWLVKPEVFNRPGIDPKIPFDLGVGRLGRGTAAPGTARARRIFTPRFVVAVATPRIPVITPRLIIIIFLVRKVIGTIPNVIVIILVFIGPHAFIELHLLILVLIQGLTTRGCRRP